MIRRELHSIDQVRNQYTLNLFSDASMRGGPNKTMAGCYGVVAVVGDQIIDRMYRVHSIATVNQEELRGVRGSIRLALKHGYKYERINIFTDSLVTVTVIENFNSYRYNSDTNLIYKKYSKYGKKEPLENQSLIIEVVQLLIKLIASHPDVNIYHQKGHVDINNITNLKKAADKFRTINKIKYPIDLNLTRYLSIFNDLVDHESRSLLHVTNVYNNYYCDPVQFFAIKKITI